MKSIEDNKWYPMRSTYGRELKVKECFDKIGIECYVPMTYKVVDTNGERHRQLVPAIHNLIFVHSSENVIKQLKQNNPLFNSLRFIMKKSISDKDNKDVDYLIVPTNQMENFILATKNHEEEVTYLNGEKAVCKQGQKVKVVDGMFSGVEGEIIRIHKNKRVVIRIDNIPVVMLNFVPNCYLEIDSDNTTTLLV